MSSPKFLLTKKIPLNILRKTQGTYVGGDWVPGSETVVPIEVNIQPAKDSELMLMPESERTKDWYKVYSTSEIRSAKEGTGGWDADEFIYNGDRYRVMKVRFYAMGIQDHYRAMAALIPRTPN